MISPDAEVRTANSVADDDRTRIPAAVGRLSDDDDPLRPPAQNALAVGTRLLEFEIRGVIAEGGFGIVYRAFDEALHRVVAIKEYMPSILARRTESNTVAIKSERHAEPFDTGLRSFINEARLLARFDHPSLVKVYRFWEANHTAYMAMPLLEGVTLRDALRDPAFARDEASLKRLLRPILEALAVMHASQCYHRDIAPDNIMLLPDGRPILLDFGAARRVIGDMSHAPTVILKPGYAPIEQYASIAALRQGPWTDVYAIGAVLYFAIAGRAPLPAVTRMVDDTLEPLASIASDRYTPEFLRGIDRALGVMPRNRPRTVDELARDLGLAEAVAPVRSIDARGPSRLDRLLARLPSPELLIAGAILLLVVIVAGWLSTRKSNAPEPPALISVPPSAPPAPEPPRSAPAGQGYDALRAFEEVIRHRASDRGVSISIERPTVRIGIDVPRLTIRSTRAGYTYVFRASADPKRIQLVFPNGAEHDNWISLGGLLQLPSRRWERAAVGPAGATHYLVIVSDHPLDFGTVGAMRSGLFSDVRSDIARERYSAHPGPRPFLAGDVDCPESQPACSQAYGAARATIREVSPGRE